MDLTEFNSDKYVANYTNFNRVIKDILPFNEIRISSAHKANDPYEKDDSWIDNEPSGTDEDALECSYILSELKLHIYNYIKIFCVASYDKCSEKVTDISSDIYAKPRMWATYGDNHKGLCLIFDKDELSKEFSKIDSIKIYEGKIKYLNYIPLIQNNVALSIKELRSICIKGKKYNTELLYNAIDNNYLLKSKYFRKHIDWKTENEYRWLVFTKEAKDLNLNFAKSLKAIVLGVETDERYICLLEKYNIPLYKLLFNDGKYKSIKLSNPKFQKNNKNAISNY